eukprot:sb/3476644/
MDQESCLSSCQGGAVLFQKLVIRINVDKQDTYLLDTWFGLLNHSSGRLPVSSLLATSAVARRHSFLSVAILVTARRDWERPVASRKSLSTQEGHAAVRGSFLSNVCHEYVPIAQL